MLLHKYNSTIFNIAQLYDLDSTILDIIELYLCNHIIILLSWCGAIACYPAKFVSWTHHEVKFRLLVTRINKNIQCNSGMITITFLLTIR